MVPCAVLQYISCGRSRQLSEQRLYDVLEYGRIQSHVGSPPITMDIHSNMSRYEQILSRVDLSLSMEVKNKSQAGKPV